MAERQSDQESENGEQSGEECNCQIPSCELCYDDRSDSADENDEQSGEECNCQIPSCELCYDDRSDSADENDEQSGRATPNHDGRGEPLPPPPPTCHYYDHSQHHYHFWQAPPMVVPHLSLPPLHHPPGHDGYDTSDSEEPSQPFAWSDRGAPVLHPQHESTSAENAPPPDLPLWAWRDPAGKERGDRHRARRTSERRRSHARGERQSTERRRAQ